MYESGLVLLTATSRTLSTERPASLQDVSTRLRTSSRFLGMSTPASLGDASAALLIAKDDDVKGRSRFLVLMELDVVVVVVTNDETNDLRVVTLHIHSANVYVQNRKAR